MTRFFGSDAEPLEGRGATAPVELLCIPAAGESTLPVFGRWARWLAPSIEVVTVEWLPAVPAEERSLEGHLERLVEERVGAWAGGNRPYALFGHRTGALVAFELVRVLARRGRPTPLHLFISGCTPPPPEWLRDAPDPEMLELLRVADSDRSVGSLEDTVELYTRERQLVRDHRPGAQPPLEIGVTVLRGVKDLDGDSDRLEGWRRWTTGPVDILSIGGDHFFLFDQQHVVAAALRERLQAGTHPAAEVTPVLSLNHGYGAQVQAHGSGDVP